MHKLNWIEADWPVDPGIRAISTYRTGGVSQTPYDTLNFGQHVGDDPDTVRANRKALQEHLNLPSEPVWLDQVHGRHVINAADPTATRTADAAYTEVPGVVCAVMTADCLPVLLYSPESRKIAAVHAGWKGLAGGVIDATVTAMAESRLLAWLGPCIGPEAFEVGGEVRQTFIDQSQQFEAGFVSGGQDKWLADLSLLAKIALGKLGIDQVYGGGWCTYKQTEHFFSYRRDRTTGRMATLIWRQN